MRNAKILFALASLLPLGCASSKQVRFDEMSAERHRQEAALERAKAEEAYAHYEPASQPTVARGALGGMDAPYLYPITVYPVGSMAVHLQAAQNHLQHAREHEHAAVALETFEEAECRDFPPKTRAACPVLEPVARVEKLDDGVRVHLEHGANVEAIVAHMRCHLAFAKARGFEQVADCPLYIRGVAIERGKESGSVEIRSRDAKVIEEIYKRAKEIF